MLIMVHIVLASAHTPSSAAEEADETGRQAHGLMASDLVVVGSIVDVTSGKERPFTDEFRAYIEAEQPQLAEIDHFRPWDFQLVALDVTDVLAQETKGASQVHEGDRILVYAMTEVSPLHTNTSREAVLFLDRYVGAWGEPTAPYSASSTSFVLSTGMEQFAAWLRDDDGTRCDAAITNINRASASYVIGFSEATESNTPGRPFQSPVPDEPSLLLSSHLTSGVPPCTDVPTWDAVIEIVRTAASRD